MIQPFISNYFGFNRQQRNGLLVLIIIVFILLLVRVLYPSFIKPAKISIQNLPLVERKIDSACEAATTYNKPYKEKSKTALFVFDPNTVTGEQLLALGFREKAARTFLKYRSKGVVFKDKKDLQKIYGISGEFYSRLEPYIFIKSGVAPEKPVELRRLPEKEMTAKTPAQKTIELNSCDSAALIGLNGVGPSYARRILKYRVLLGGYVSVEQLKEVYGFPEDLFEKVKPFVTVNAASVKKINLNVADFKTVNRHPYLSYEVTKTIFDWRRKTTLTAVNLKTILNDEALYNRLLPYIAFE